MSAAPERVTLRRTGRLNWVQGVLVAPRCWVYVSCTVFAVLASYLLGKEMMWDTLDYHFYAGFSALHDRLGRDYFAAGVQGYLNPYVYLPFYSLVMTGLPALWVASLFAVVQSGILWLTYELAVALSPVGDARLRIAAGACAALLALANPILIDQLGSSYADITTAEVVLGGWLLLVHALRTPSALRVVGAGLLLGIASALKLTNALHALSACVLLLFLPTGLRRKARLSLGFLAALALSFAAVAGPWAMRLEHHFGNPFFPLLNSVFRSPHLPPVSLADYRFVPSSFAEALSRPFAIALPVRMVDNEYSSPDVRYALLLALALIVLTQWGWRRLRPAPDTEAARDGAPVGSESVALACAFLTDWVLWLRASGNGRYFLPMACIGGALAVVLAFRILATRRRVLVVLMVGVLVVQSVQLALGTEYRTSAPWDGGAWFEVSVPAEQNENPNLYFLLGDQTDSFIAPFFAAGSAFVNLGGAYVLRPDGANGASVRSLLRQYGHHIRVVNVASAFKLGPVRQLPELSHVDYTLAPFGLRADTSHCLTIIARDMRASKRKLLPGMLPIQLPQLEGKVTYVPQSPDGYLVACRVTSDPAARIALANAAREPNLVFDRMESECPGLFQPPRPATKVYGDGQGGYLWVREYSNTNLTAVLGEDYLRLVDGTRGGQPQLLGNESDWARAPMPLECGRYGEHYYAKPVSSAR